MRRSVPRRRAVPALSLLIALVLLPWSPVDPTLTASAAAPKAGDIIPGRLLVRFAASATVAQREAVLGRAKARTMRTLRIVPGLQIVTATDSPGALRRLRAESIVQSVEPDRYITTAHIPDDPGFGAQWSLDEPGDHDIDAPEAWDVTTGDPSVVIGIVDTGVDLDHPDLAPNLWTNPDEIAGNGLDDDDNGYVDDVHGWDFYADDATPDDEHGHGTQVAGIAAAVADNGLGTAGVAHDSRIMVLRILGPGGGGALSSAAQAMDYAWRMGVRVLNLSWTWGPGVIQPIDDVIAEAGANGVVTVTAAGNQGLDVDPAPVGPGSVDDPSVINVASSDSLDALAPSSNRGLATVDVAAPGVGILTTQRDGTTTLASGTSMAAPHVAGVAALVAAEHPDWTAVQIRDRIIATVRPVAGLGAVVASGGVVNARTALAGPDDAAPVVTLTAPTPGTTALPGTRVTFKASATDPEDGSVSASLTWWSSLDGQLGDGPVITVPDLSGGQHFISAVATDDAGNHASRSIVLTVGPRDTVISTSPIHRSWSIAVGPNGSPRIAAVREDTGTYVHTRSAAGSWSGKLVATAELSNGADIAIDEDGSASVAIGQLVSSIAVFADPGIMVASATGSTWAVDRATMACDFSCRWDEYPSLVFDAAGRERFVFMRQGDPNGAGPAQQPGVYAGRRTANGDLVTSLVRATRWPASPTLAIDADGTAHTAWVVTDGDEAGVWYATDGSGDWVATPLALGPGIRSSALAVGGDGSVHVVRATASGVQVRTRTGTTWGTWSTIRAAAAATVAIATDDAGGVHVAAGLVDGGGTPSGIAYLRRQGGPWVSTTVASGYATTPDLAVDGSGAAHLAYHGPAGDGSGLRYSTNATGAWIHKTVVGDSTFAAVGYDVDARGVAHVALSRTGIGSGFFVGDDASGGWTLAQAVPGPGEPLMRPGFAVSAIGERHLVVGTGYEPGLGLEARSVYYATDASGTWKRVRIGDNGDGATRPLVIDRFGHVHVAFAAFDGFTRSLVYATDASGSWITTRVRTGVWREPSMAVGPDGVVHLAVIEQPATGGFRVVYLTNASGSWVATPLSSGSYVTNPSIALDPEGDPNVVFIVDGMAVRLTDRRDGTWRTRMVEPDASAYSASLVIDSNGTRRILYDQTTSDYSACEVPLCPDYPGLMMAVGGPTGAFTLTHVSYNGYDYRPAMVRGKDGSLSAGFSHGVSSVRQMDIAPGPVRTATRLLDGSPASVKRGATATLKATLTTAAGAPLVGKSVMFKVDGVTIGSATTNASGVATRSWTASVPAGAHMLTIGFLGGGAHLATRIGPRPLTVAPSHLGT